MRPTASSGPPSVSNVEAVSHPDSFGARSSLEVGGEQYEIFRLDALAGDLDVAKLPYSVKVLLENLLRNEDGDSVTKESSSGGGLAARRRALARRSRTAPAAC